MSQFAEPVIPDELAYGERDPWFDRLTTLSEVEGESSECDELRHSLLRGEETCSYPSERNKQPQSQLEIDSPHS